MLNRHIVDSYYRAVKKRSTQSNISVRWSASSASEDRKHACSAGTAVFETDVPSWVEDPDLQDEIFGPATLIVRGESRSDLLQIAQSLDGNLTATILGNADDLLEFSDLVAILEKKVGRILFNNFPTGVEVCEAMVHGGSYPATSDSRSTSVGGRAILRFTRPVCYQNFPDSALPPELQETNPLGIWRMEDGRHAQPKSANE
jgi:NADP-dependent aldehyde dehydrogenase